MKIFSTLILILIIAGSMSSCKKEQKVDSTPQMPLTTDVEGVYQGKLPCEDCEAQLVTLQLNMDNTMLATAAKIGKEGTAVAKYGTWNLNGRNVTTTIGNETAIYTFSDLGNLQITIDGKVYVLNRETD